MEARTLRPVGTRVWDEWQVSPTSNDTRPYRVLWEVVGHVRIQTMMGEITLGEEVRAIALEWGHGGTIQVRGV